MAYTLIKCIAKKREKLAHEKYLMQQMPKSFWVIIQ